MNVDGGGRANGASSPPPSQGTALFDFTGTGQEVYGNWNAPRAITLSALIYCLRCMVGEDIPLNQVQREGQLGGASPWKSWGAARMIRRA